MYLLHLLRKIEVTINSDEPAPAPAPAPAPVAAVPPVADPAPAPVADPTADPAPAAAPKATKAFTQEEVNTMMAKEKSKNDDKIKGISNDLESFKEKARLTGDQSVRLTEQLDLIRKQTMTQAEIAEEERLVLENENATKFTEASAKAEKWESKYKEELLERTLLLAAEKHNAFSGEQVVRILQPKTRLVEAMNEQNEPTGDFNVLVGLESLQEDGSVQTLELTAQDAVERMTGIESYMNLFKANGTSGMNLHQAANPTGATDKKAMIQTDATSYVEKRLAGDLKL